jgi:hypothetical protein
LHQAPYLLAGGGDAFAPQRLMDSESSIGPSGSGVDDPDALGEGSIVELALERDVIVRRRPNGKLRSWTPVGSRRRPSRCLMAPKCWWRCLAIGAAGWWLLRLGLQPIQRVRGRWPHEARGGAKSSHITYLWPASALLSFRRRGHGPLDPQTAAVALDRAGDETRVLRRPKGSGCL